MSVIRGENAILYWKSDGYFKPIACMESCNVTTNTELSETSTVQTGIYRTYRGNRNTWTVSCQGLCSFDENHPHVKFRLLQQSFTPVPISFTATDENGISETFTGNVIITSLPTDSAANDFYTYSIDATGTGAYTITDIPIDPNECCQDAWIYYTGNGTEGKSITLASLIGKQIAGRLYRDGIEYRPSGVDHDGTGTPVGKQFKFVKATGQITFASTIQDIESGEPIDIPYNLCGSSTACNIIINNIVAMPDTDDSNRFHIEFLPTLGDIPTAPDDVNVRYSIDNGATWIIPASITYNPLINYQLVVINDALSLTEDYLFEITPICNDVPGNSGVGYYTQCVPVSFEDFTLPDAYVGETYNHTETLMGTAPFVLSGITKPSWMTIGISGSILYFWGEPDVAGEDLPVEFSLSNCDEVSSADFDGTINVIEVIPTETRFTNRTFVSGSALTSYETIQLEGAPGATVVFKLDNYVNNNGGTLKVNASIAFLNNTFTFVLNGSGMSSVIAVNIDGSPGHVGSVILGHFTIISTTAGTIGTPSTYQVSKIFT